MLKTGVKAGIVLLIVLEPGMIVRAAAPLRPDEPNSYTTENFVVHAPTTKIAKRIGKWAERYRKQKAELWLGKELPTWDRPCPLKVSVTGDGTGVATSFAFDSGKIVWMDMQVEGSLDRIVASALPTGVTHTVFAYHFREPVPRWAEEGGAVLSGDDRGRARYDRLVRKITDTSGRYIPLRRLFALTEYPRDVLVLFAEGYSVTDFLVKARDRKTFLAFVKQGQKDGWDTAAKVHYKYARVEDLEVAWLASLKKAKQPQGPK